MPQNEPLRSVQVDIVSDVVCPWCVVGFLQLARALQATGLRAQLRWHPFELNPAMPAEGQNLREHIQQKYGSTKEQSDQVRRQLVTLGADLGFAFNFTDESRIVNTFAAHQLLDWAETLGRQTDLKQALFAAYFTSGEDVSQPEVLASAVQRAGLDPETAREVLANGSHANPVREKQEFWTSRGISGVPSMVFASKYLVTGAQGADNYVRILQRCIEEAA